MQDADTFYAAPNQCWLDMSTTANPEVYNRELRSMTTMVDDIFAQAKQTVQPIVSKHIALLIMVLQTMSDIITFVIGKTHPFYTVARDMGLDTSTLCAALNSEMLADAKLPENQTHDFWHSPTLEKQYWGLMLRCMLDANKETWEHPLAGQVVALSIRFRMVGPVAKRLLGLIRDVFAKCAPKSQLITSVRLRLLALLRQPAAANPTADIDPLNVIPRGLHNRQFAGAIDRMPSASVQAFKDIGARMTQAYGAAAANAVLAAAELAGIRTDAAYAGMAIVDADPDAVSVLTNKRDMDCSVLLKAKAVQLQRLDDLLHHLDVADETRMFEKVLDKTDMPALDVFYNVLEGEEDSDWEEDSTEEDDALDATEITKPSEILPATSSTASTGGKRRHRRT
jgi:hypothetical protein